jgi:hypothetical protein
MSSESIAEAFHDAYEDLAIGFGQRPGETAKPWMSVPYEYRQLLTATFGRYNSWNGEEVGWFSQRAPSRHGSSGNFVKNSRGALS